VTELQEWLTLSQAGELLNVSPNRVRQFIREGQLVGVRRDREQQVPAAFIDDNGIVKGLPGTITLLRDAGYSDEEVLAWLTTADDSLPGTPIQALRENRGTEVKRRAQAAGF
jgi:hypothetical protein